MKKKTALLNLIKLLSVNNKIRSRNILKNKKISDTQISDTIYLINYLIKWRHINNIELDDKLSVKILFNILINLDDPQSLQVFEKEEQRNIKSNRSF